MERLFEPPAVGKMSPAAKVVAHAPAVIWSLFVLFPIYWVMITSFKDAAAVNQGPFYIPFIDFQPNLDAWRVQFSDPSCDLPSVVRQIGLLVLQFLCFVVVAGVEPSAHGAADLQGVPGLHQFHRCQCRIHCFLRGFRLNGRLCAGPDAVQAQVRQHHDVRTDCVCCSSPTSLRWRTLVGRNCRWPCVVLLAGARHRQALHPHTSAMATSCSGSFRSASCRRSSWSSRST